MRMKTVILSDELWSEILESLEANQKGRDALAKLEMGAPPLPSDRDLIRLSRTKGEAPAAFKRAVAYRDAGRQAAEDTRLALNDLILDAHRAGVGPRVLARWAGLKEARLFEIIAPARTSV